MKKAVWSGFLVAAGFLLLSTPAFAQATDTASLAVSVTVNAHARLQLGAASIAFSDEDPDLVPSILAPALSVNVRARTSATGTVLLTVQASGDLTSGTNAIAINNLTWTAAGAGLVGGTSNATTGQTVGSWTGSGSRAGSQTYALANSWNYAIGSYTGTLTYTLVAP